VKWQQHGFQLVSKHATEHEQPYHQLFDIQSANNESEDEFEARLGWISEIVVMVDICEGPGNAPNKKHAYMIACRILTVQKCPRPTRRPGLQFHFRRRRRQSWARGTRDSTNWSKQVSVARGLCKFEHLFTRLPPPNELAAAITEAAGATFRNFPVCADVGKKKILFVPCTDSYHAFVTSCVIRPAVAQQTFMSAQAAKVRRASF
jgi:hypothetical protein